MSYKNNPKGYTRCEKCKHIDRKNEKCKITNDNWLVSDRAGTCHQFEGVESMKAMYIGKNNLSEKLTNGVVYEVEDMLLVSNVLYFKVVNDEGSEVWTFSKYFREIIEKNIEEAIKIMDDCHMSSTDKEINNNVDHPSHYNKGKFEVIDVIEGWNLGFNLGNTIKYIARCEYKENKKQDLEKAMWYLKRELERLEKENN